MMKSELKPCPQCNSEEISSYPFFNSVGTCPTESLHCTCKNCEYEYSIDESGKVYRWPFITKKVNKC